MSFCQDRAGKVSILMEIRKWTSVSSTHSIRKSFFSLNVVTQVPHQWASKLFLHCHPLPTYATSTHKEKNSTHASMHTACAFMLTHTHIHTHLFLINTQTPPPYLYTHRDTQKLCSFPLASSSPCLYFNLQKKSSPKSQRGIQELRLQRHTLACTHTHMNTQSHRDTQQDGAEWATRQVWRLARISISN